MAYKVKQVIVVRKDLNMRKGKIAAQVAHGSMLFLMEKMREFGKADIEDLTFEEYSWIMGPFAKVVVSVNSEDELLSVYDLAIKNDLKAKIVIDSGATEFNGVPTKTCVCIGPHWSEKFEDITSNLPLM